MIKKRVVMFKRKIGKKGGNKKRKKKQGPIHGNVVPDGWAGAEMQKLTDRLTDQTTDWRPTYRHGKV